MSELPTMTELDWMPDADDRVESKEEAYALIRGWLDDNGWMDIGVLVLNHHGPGGGAVVADFSAPSHDRLREFVTFYEGTGDEHEIEYLLGLRD